MSKQKALEICNNLEQTINKFIASQIRSDNPMFEKPTANLSKLKQRQKELMEKYNITKNNLK